jgi:hypothetical protein
MCGSSATASASACCPQRIVLNVRVTGVTVRVFVPTVPELATSTVNVVFVAPTEIAVIFAEAIRLYQRFYLRPQRGHRKQHLLQQW